MLALKPPNIFLPAPLVSVRGSESQAGGGREKWWGVAWAWYKLKGPAPLPNHQSQNERPPNPSTFYTGILSLVEGLRRLPPPAVAKGDKRLHGGLCEGAGGGGQWGVLSGLNRKINWRTLLRAAHTLTRKDLVSCIRQHLFFLRLFPFSSKLNCKHWWDGSCQPARTHSQQTERNTVYKYTWNPRIKS